MPRKNPRYIYNPLTLEYEQKKESPVWDWLLWAFRALTAAAFVYLVFWLYTSVLGLDLPKTAYLKRRHADWEAKTSLMSSTLSFYDEVLRGIEDRNDDVYRSIFGLNEIPEELKYSGLEGAKRYAYLDEYGANPAFGRLVRGFDVMMKRVYIQSRALDEVDELARKAGDMASCVPSVPPIAPLEGGFKITSSFGYRIDPIFGNTRMHRGQDFGHALGEPVYATGDGVVESTGYQFGGYGNQVVINHGYGYRTRYAHLNTILVNPGMKVRRADQIGTLGNTGKSTGPHLHYEVEYRGNCVNPLNYFDRDISRQEYLAMVRQREEESPSGKMVSTSEILKKRRTGDE